MKVTEIKVSAWFEQKVNLGDYQNATFGSGGEATASIEEGDSIDITRKALRKGLQERIEEDVKNDISEFIKKWKLLQQKK